MIRRDTGLECDEWAFGREPTAAPRHHDDPRRQSVVHARLERQASDAWYPVELEPAEGLVPARLVSADIRDAYVRLKCACGFSYAPVGADDDSLHMMGRRTPEGMIAYDPGDVERWFWTLGGCESARVEANAAIERDGRQATRIGVHPIEHPWLY